MLRTENLTLTYHDGDRRLNVVNDISLIIEDYQLTLSLILSVLYSICSLFNNFKCCRPPPKVQLWLSLVDLLFI